MWKHFKNNTLCRGNSFQTATSHYSFEQWRRQTWVTGSARPLLFNPSSRPLRPQSLLSSISPHHLHLIVLELLHILTTLETLFLKRIKNMLCAPQFHFYLELWFCSHCILHKSYQEQIKGFYFLKTISSKCNKFWIAKIIGIQVIALLRFIGGKNPVLSIIQTYTKNVLLTLYFTRFSYANYHNSLYLLFCILTKFKYVT